MKKTISLFAILTAAITLNSCWIAPVYQDYETVGKAVETKEELIEAINTLKSCGRAAFIDCRIHKGLARKLPPIIFDHREAIDALIDGLNR